jgi:hypothetical protein
MMKAVVKRWISMMAAYRAMTRSAAHPDSQHRNGTWDYLWSVGELRAVDGVFIASILRGADSVPSRRIWRALEREYQACDPTTARNAAGLAWDIRVLVPRGRR